MKTKLLSLLVLPIILLTGTVTAQTTLAPGDIAVFQNQADTPDDFSFVTFVDIDAGTGIYFTDCGTTTVGGFRMPACTEGALKYTVPAGGLNAGDIIRLSTSTSDFANYSDTRITGSMALASSGDQVVVFQDATSASGGTNAANTPTFLFILHNSSTQFGGDPSDSNESQVPPGLSDVGLPRTAVAVGAGPGVDVEWDDTVYNGTYDFSGEADLASSIAAAKIAMTDPANYTRVNDITDPTYAANVTAIPGALMLFTLSTEEFEANSITMYPNPANNFITISGNTSSVKEISIYDVTGKELIKTSLINNQVDISKLNSGMYLVNLRGENLDVVKKLIKQ